MNIRDAIESYKPPLHKLHIPSWNVDVWLKPLSAKQRITLARWIQNDNPLDTEVIGTMLIRSIADEDGNLVFTDADLEMIQSKDLDSLILLNNHINQINGIGGENPFPTTKT